MVVCKYFQQGYCRYSNSCRFDHIYGSKYSYHAPQSSQQAVTAPAQTQSVTDEQLVNQVTSDIQAVLKGNQWILSGYAPFKEKATLPGLVDLSFEEARLFIYEAKVNNNVDQAAAYLNNLFKEARLKHEQLLQPNSSMIKVLRNIYNGEIVSSPFTNTGQNGFGNPVASVFRSAVQGTPAFGQNPAANSMFNMQASTNQSVFGQQNNAFSSPSSDPAKSIFAQASQNIFGSPQNQTQDSNPKSIFASSAQQFFGSDQFNQNQTSPFQSNQNANVFQSTDVFNNVFQSSESSVFKKSETLSNVFQQSEGQTNVFGVARPNDQQSEDSSIYSLVENLTEDALEAFKSDEFKLGFIPELPPPRELCI